ncbi:LysR family transcriptional regulator [Halobacillus sp. K22]|uniref:LysR family transcriptional regulator n=1 Tax=Halobacillus sp. K22 TaxID=3457431 RepID=UPI003FCD813E
MKMEDYELLLHLHRIKTIRGTAKKILISQPAITQRLKYIESHFGGAIFLRTPKQLVPTALGESILKHAEEVITREYDFHDRLLQQAVGEVAGTLSIGASSLFSQHFLPGVLEAYTKKYPSVTIDLVTGVSDEIRDSSTPFHVYVVRGEPIRTMVSHHLFDDPLYLIDTKPLNKSRARPLIEFKSDPGFQKVMEDWMAVQPHHAFKRSIKVDQFETAKQLMKRGLGMAVLPKSASRDLEDFYSIPLEVDKQPLSRKTWACYQEGLRQLLQVDAFIYELENTIWFDEEREEND